MCSFFYTAKTRFSTNDGKMHGICDAMQCIVCSNTKTRERGGGQSEKIYVLILSSITCLILFIILMNEYLWLRRSPLDRDGAIDFKTSFFKLYFLVSPKYTPLN